MTGDAGTTDERSADEIRRDIETRREEIGRTVEQIQETVRTRLDWREQVARRPGLAFGTAALVGLWAGLVVARRLRRS